MCLEGLKAGDGVRVDDRDAVLRMTSLTLLALRSILLWFRSIVLVGLATSARDKG